MNKGNVGGGLGGGGGSGLGGGINRAHGKCVVCMAELIRDSYNCLIIDVLREHFKIKRTLFKYNVK